MILENILQTILYLIIAQGRRKKRTILQIIPVFFLIVAETVKIVAPIVMEWIDKLVYNRLINR